MSWTQETIDQTLRAVVERSMSDGGFRTLALRDAKGAISNISATPIPSDFRVQFVDNAGYDLTVVLPDVPAGDQSGVSDAELAGVAGGTIGGIGSIATAYCVGFTSGCLATASQLTACNPLYTKKPNSPTLCPH